MASTAAGNPFTLTAWFAQDSPDPPLPPTPTPDGVTFSVTAPDRDETDFVFGVDSEVANPATNLFTCTLSADFLDAPGEYRWKAAGTLLGEVTQTLYGTLYATGDATEVSPPSRPPGPVLGPCWAWITGDDVAAASGIPHGSNPGLFDKVAYESMQALYEISGRLFNGICEWAVRPCANENCGCWGGPPSYGFGQAWWTGTPWGTSGGWGWYNERGDRFGCKPMSRVRLAGTVREIVRVHIDGVLLPEYDADTGYRNYRLDNWTDLVRMDTPDGNGSSTPQFWPGCQNLSLDADQPGTFEVLYKWGVDPPEVARTAATELANQLYLSTNAFNVSEAGIAVLPQGVTKIDRQGIIIERQMLVNWMNATERTGLVNLDSFLTAYVHAGKRGGRTPMIWSPDVQQFPRRVGDGTSTAGS